MGGPGLDGGGQILPHPPWVMKGEGEEMMADRPNFSVWHYDHFSPPWCFYNLCHLQIRVVDVAFKANLKIRNKVNHNIQLYQNSSRWDGPYAFYCCATHCFSRADLFHYTWAHLSEQYEVFSVVQNRNIGFWPIRVLNYSFIGKYTYYWRRRGSV